MCAQPVTIRSGTIDDLPIMRRMLMEAAYWRPGVERPPMEEALAHPELAKLLADWGRAGDEAVIAELRSGESIGAAWYRLWTDDNHSYGYVAEDVPELAIGIDSNFRGRGVGTNLLSALLNRSHEMGIKRVSLSVEKDNPAQRLYRRHGFRRIAEVGNAWTMAVEVKP